MTTGMDLTNESSFAATHDVPIGYMQRTREYYLALGYGEPYRWAHFAEVPFHRLAKPLASCRVAIVTTAAPYQPECGDQVGRVLSRDRKLRRQAARREYVAVGSARGFLACAGCGTA